MMCVDVVCRTVVLARCGWLCGTGWLVGALYSRFAWMTMHGPCAHAPTRTRTRTTRTHHAHAQTNRTLKSPWTTWCRKALVRETWMPPFAVVPATPTPPPTAATTACVSPPPRPPRDRPVPPPVCRLPTKTPCMRSTRTRTRTRTTLHTNRRCRRWPMNWRPSGATLAWCNNSVPPPRWVARRRLKTVVVVVVDTTQRWVGSVGVLLLPPSPLSAQWALAVAMTRLTTPVPVDEGVWLGAGRLRHFHTPPRTCGAPVIDAIPMPIPAAATPATPTNHTVPVVPVVPVVQVPVVQVRQEGWVVREPCLQAPAAVPRCHHVDHAPRWGWAVGAVARVGAGVVR